MASVSMSLVLQVVAPFVELQASYGGLISDLLSLMLVCFIGITSLFIECCPLAGIRFE